MVYERFGRLNKLEKRATELQEDLLKRAGQARAEYESGLNATDPLKKAQAVKQLRVAEDLFKRADAVFRKVDTDGEGGEGGDDAPA